MDRERERKRVIKRREKSDVRARVGPRVLSFLPGGNCLLRVSSSYVFLLFMKRKKKVGPLFPFHFPDYFSKKILGRHKEGTELSVMSVQNVCACNQVE